MTRREVEDRVQAILGDDLGERSEAVIRQALDAAFRSDHYDPDRHSGPVRTSAPGWVLVWELDERINAVGYSVPEIRVGLGMSLRTRATVGGEWTGATIRMPLVAEVANAPLSVVLFRCWNHLATKERG